MYWQLQEYSRYQIEVIKTYLILDIELRLNDLYDFSSTSIVHYDMVLRHLDFLDHILVGEKLLDLINTTTNYS